MDNSPDGAEIIAPLPYDDTVAYEEQVPLSDFDRPSLANRIGNTKVYLLSESSTSRLGKRKHVEGEEDSTMVDDDNEMDEDLTYRGNALLLQGSPISHLPTAGLFAYATHFDAHPMGLEWVDDNTCVFVFRSKAAARTGYQYLMKFMGEDPNADGLITAKPIPISLWPPEERISNSLGKGQGLKGTIHMRWAKVDDVKKKGAKKDSEFYRKHGEKAGKEVYSGLDDAPAKRRRLDGIEDEALQRAQLDNDLEQFLADSDPEPTEPPSPPSKMRSDYIASDGRTLLERTSVLRAHPSDALASRLMSSLPHRPRSRRGEQQGLHSSEGVEWGRESRSLGQRSIRDRAPVRSGQRDRPTRVARPKKTQQELDDELDAFLNDKD